MRHTPLTALCLTVAGSAALADEAFVRANVMDIFYHELGHAILDVEALPLFGKEETAADFFANVYMQTHHSAAEAEAHILHVADGYLAEAQLEEEAEAWGTHDTNMERHYNVLCLLYGADPRGRRFLVRDDHLPQDRAESCEEEFDIAHDSWGWALDELADTTVGFPLIFVSEVGEPSLAQDVLAAEVDRFNGQYRLSKTVTVYYDVCDEANAFYDPMDRAITFCAEYEHDLYDLAPAE